MLDLLQTIDHELFRLINLHWTNPVFDWIFPFITDLHKIPYLGFVFVPAFYLVLYKAKGLKQSLLIFVGLAAAVGASDIFGSQVIKPYFERLRPPLSGVDHLIRAPHFGGYSFISNHAANIFCAAIFLSWFFPKGRWLFLLYAFLVAYSRVYVGVHFPSDVIGGALVGALFGLSFALATAKVQSKIQRT